MTEKYSRINTGQSDKEIVIKRVFDAPRNLVFEAWTDKKHIAHWWGPNGFTITTYEMDVKPGGVWRFTMHGPDGVDYPNKIVYDEIVKPELLVFSHFGEVKGESVQFQTTVTFVEKDGMTELVMRMLFPSAAERDLVVKEYGAIEGGNQTLGRLEKYLTNMNTQKELIITRVFDAPRDLVWRAWTDPEMVKRWWGPRGVTNPTCELDARPGGKIDIVMLAGKEMGNYAGQRWPMTGTFREVTPQSRLVYFSGAVEEADGTTFVETETTVDFEDLKGKTRMRLHIVVTKAAGPKAEFALQGMEMGWTQSIDKLGEELGKQ